MIVYSVDDRTSFLKAEEMLSYLKQANDSMEKSGKVSTDKAVILVANKVDLQRSRIVTSKGMCPWHQGGCPEMMP